MAAASTWTVAASTYDTYATGYETSMISFVCIPSDDGLSLIIIIIIIFFFFFFFFFFINLQPLKQRSTTNYEPFALDSEPGSLTDILRLSLITAARMTVRVSRLHQVMDTSSGYVHTIRLWTHRQVVAHIQQVVR